MREIHEGYTIGWNGWIYPTWGFTTSWDTWAKRDRVRCFTMRATFECGLRTNGCECEWVMPPPAALNLCTAGLAIILKNECGHELCVRVPLLIWRTSFKYFLNQEKPKTWMPKKQYDHTTIMEGWRSDFLYKLVLLVVNVPSNWTWYYLILHPLIAFCTAWNYCSREVRSFFHLSTSTRTQPAIPIFCTIIPLISHLSRRAKALFPVGWSADNLFVQHKG